jgi:hypothetical protein
MNCNDGAKVGGLMEIEREISGGGSGVIRSSPENLASVQSLTNLLVALSVLEPGTKWNNSKSTFAP